LICLAIAIILAIYGLAYAGPECKTYGLFYVGEYYSIRFSCETSGIGAAYTAVNDVQYSTYLYFFTGDMVYIPGFANFEYLDNGIWWDGGDGFMFWLE
jgi:hypothetical protein